MALEGKADQRELTSILISDLYSEFISDDDMANGFDCLLENLEDLCLDTPDAAELLGCFIARAVADDCLPPSYVSNHSSGSEKTKIALKRAEVLLKLKHGMVRLDAVWGVAGGRRPVKVLINKMNLLLQEYLSSDDLQEAERCLLDLEVPHFHHELVFEAVVMVLEDGSDRCSEKMVQLLKYLSDSNIITPDQMKNGFLRVFDNMADISLDVPNAHHVLERFASSCFGAGFMSRAVKAKVPAMGRKRFVSEGDSLIADKETTVKTPSVS
jgi:programmed cell death protein 4